MTAAKGNFETISPNIQVSIDKPIFADHGNLMLGAQFGKNTKIEHTNIRINYSQKADSVQDHFHGLPVENHAFVDRPGVFEKLNETLKKAGGSRIAALKGLGGMGKTQIMLRYSYSHRTEYDYVFWLEMDGKSMMYDSFRKLAVNLGLDVESIKGEDSEIIIANWARAWLERKKRWLLLLDNADEVVAKMVFKYLPRIGGDIILTTREDIPQSKAPMVLVDKMEKEEALRLLFGTSSIDTVNRESQQFFDAQKIVTELDNMPLAIDLARAYIETTNTSFQTYLEIFKHVDLLKFSDEDIADDYQHTVATVWQLSFEQVRNQNPIAVKIMEACAFLHSELIPVRLFEREYSALEIKSILPPLSTRERCQGAVREAIAVLAKFSFVTRTLKKVEDDEEDPEIYMLNIHRLVQKVIYDRMDSEKRLHWAHSIATALNKDADFSKDSTAIYALPTRRIMDTYIFHIRHFVNLLGDPSQKPLKSKDLSLLLERAIWYLLQHGIYFGIDELAQFSYRVSEAAYGNDYGGSLMTHAELYRCQGKYDEAEPLYQRALAITEKSLGSEHLDTAALLQNLGSLYFHQGKYDEAESLYKRSLAIYEKSLGSEHQETAMALNNLAGPYMSQSKYDEAELLYKRSLTIYEKSLGPEHPDTAQSLQCLAILYDIWGKYDEAEPLYKRSLAIREKSLGSEHPSTALSLINLGTHYFYRGRYDEAEPLYKRSLVIKEKSLGSEHPETAVALSNLASLYNDWGKYDEAEPLFGRALAIWGMSLGSEHPEAAWTFNGLATLYKNRGKYNEAERLYNRALAINEKSLEPEHPNTAVSLQCLAILYDIRGKYDEAEPLYKRSLAIHEKSLGSEHPHTALSLNNLGNHCFYRGKYDEAERLYKQALMIFEKALGPQHPCTATILSYLASLYKTQAKYDEAELLNKRALAICEKALGPEHPDTAMSMGALAELFVHQNNYDDVESLYNRALVIQEKVSNHMHPDTALLVNNLGNLYKYQGKFDDAEALYRRALNIRENVLGLRHPATASSMSSLGDLYVLQDRYGDAEPLCKLALAIREEMLGPMHSDTATSVSIMGNFYIGEGKYIDAEPLIQRALEIRQQVLGPNHPDTTASAKNLADLHEMRASITTNRS